MFEDHPTLVAASDFEPPSCRRHVLSVELRAVHTAMVLQQVRERRGRPDSEPVTTDVAYSKS